jgi:hypothetical protein
MVYLYIRYYFITHKLKRGHIYSKRVCRTPYELEKGLYAINTPVCPVVTHKCLCFHGGYYKEDLPYILLITKQGYRRYLTC